MLASYRNKIYQRIPYIIIVLFALLGMKALFHTGLFTSHDIYHQVTRLYYYFNAVTDGQFPPYWISQLANGHGYPLFIFSYQLPWIISLPILLVGFDISIAIKMLFFLGYTLSGITMYLLCKEILKNTMAAILSSLLYLWAPYHFLTIFVGASIGVVYAFIFLPLILLGLHLSFNKNMIGIIILSLSITGLILSHILHLIYFLPTIVIFFIWEISENHRLDKKYLLSVCKIIVSGILLGLLICAFYLIPALFYKHLTYAQIESGFSSLYKRNFIDLSQLIYSKWGFGPIINNAKNGEISFQLGITQWLSILITIILLLTNKINKQTKKLALFLLIACFTNIFLLLDYSLFFWQLIEKFIIIDYPFRFILPILFSSSILAGVVLTSLKSKLQIIFFTFIVIITLYINRNHINVNLYTNTPIQDYIESETTITTNTFHEYTPLKANRKLVNQKNKHIVLPALPLTKLSQSTNLISFNVITQKNTKISIKQFYFPGLGVYIDNTPALFYVDEDGLINFVVPKGPHNIQVKFEETKLIKFSKILSLIGTIIVIFLISTAYLRRGK